VAEVEGAVGRGLRQVTDSYTTQGGNQYRNPVQIYAHAREVRGDGGTRRFAPARRLSAPRVTGPSGRFPSSLRRRTPIEPA
jgi:hypothetical protein